MATARIPRTAIGLALKVGDIVTVGRRCMGNPEGARAVVYEIYDIGHGPSPSLLFPNGAHDGFPAADLALFDVGLVGHEPTLADYRFANVIRLHQDWRDGLFDEAWKDGAA